MAQEQQSLAAAWRAKYPGAYDSIPDAELEAAIVAKYPEYETLRAPTEEPKSVGGFLNNAVDSFGRLISDTTAPIHSPVRTATGLWQAVTHPGDTLNAIGGMLKERYGGLENIGNTLYEDPFGAAADVATLATGVGGAARGALKIPAIAADVNRANRLSQVARVADVADLVTNPVRIGTAGANQALRATGRRAILGSVAPSPAVRREFGGGRAVANTIMDERVGSADRAFARSGQLADEADALIADAQRAGRAPDIPTSEVFDAMFDGRGRSPSVVDRAASGDHLGLTGETDALIERMARMERQNPGGIRPTAAQTLKREAQSRADASFRAAERGAEVGLGGETNQAIARGLRSALERRVPDVIPVNQRSRALIGAGQALESAAERNSRLFGTVGTVMGGAGAATLNPAMLLSGLALMAKNSPRIMTRIGMGFGLAGKGINSAPAIQTALAARLLEESGAGGQ